MEKGKSFEIVTVTSVVKVCKKEERGEIKYFGECEGVGGPFDLKCYHEDLEDALNRALWQIDNLMHVLTGRKKNENKEDSECEEPSFLLYDHLMREAELKIKEICHVVEEKIGSIEIVMTDQGFWGMQDGCILEANIKRQTADA